MDTAAQQTAWTPGKIEEKVAEIVGKQVDVDPRKIARDASLSTDLPLDSLDIVEISMNCEDAFDIKIPEDAKAFRTVGDIVDYVVAHTSAMKAE